jgi:hypothetical protein
VTEEKDNNAIIAKSKNKLVLSAAAQVLASIRERGKEGASTPKVFSAFWSKLAEAGDGKSGQEVFGEVVAEQFSKAMGIVPNVDGEDYSPTLRLHWTDALLRHQRAVDDGKSLDVSDLSEQELEGCLVKLAHKAMLAEDSSIRNAAIAIAVQDEKSRRDMFIACLKADPSLATEIMENGGMIVEAEQVKEIFPLPNSIVEEDEFDPSADEYKD